MTEITPHNLIRHELVGLNVRIMSAKDSVMKGIRGVIVDETRNMLAVDGKAGRIMIPKGIATFRFKLPSGVQVDVDGERLVARPENRLKTRMRRW
jgi:ribonuclease P protein subunit POP4